MRGQCDLTEGTRKISIRAGIKILEIGSQCCIHCSWHQPYRKAKIQQKISATNNTI